MCDNHKHRRIEAWITPQNSERLTSKMVQLWPGDHVHAHSTGPCREEVIVCIYGHLHLQINGNEGRMLASGEAVFIPENTEHSVHNVSDAPAQYAYVVTKRAQVVACAAEEHMARWHADAMAGTAYQIGGAK